MTVIRDDVLHALAHSAQAISTREVAECAERSDRATLRTLRRLERDGLVEASNPMGLTLWTICIPWVAQAIRDTPPSRPSVDGAS